MTISHIDQLTEWWENAERGVAHAGDTVIDYDAVDDSYTVYTLDAGPTGEWSHLRILARAPKPKPAWHNAVAVIALCDDDGPIRQVWERDSETGDWNGTQGCIAAAEGLCDVTPLIEAKVTDEMVDRAARAVTNWQYRPSLDTTITLDLGDKGSRALANDVLEAALGLDVEPTPPINPYTQEDA